MNLHLTTWTESAFRKKVIKMLQGRFMHVDETNRFADLGLSIAPKYVWQPGPLAVIWVGWEGGEGKGLLC